MFSNNSNRIVALNHQDLNNIAVEITTDAENGFATVVKLSVNGYFVFLRTLEEIEWLIRRFQDIIHDPTMFTKFYDENAYNEGFDYKNIVGVMKNITSIKNTLDEVKKEVHTVKGRIAVNQLINKVKDICEVGEVITSLNISDEKSRQKIENQYQNLQNALENLDIATKELFGISLYGIQKSGKSNLANLLDGSNRNGENGRYTISGSARVSKIPVIITGNSRNVVEFVLYFKKGVTLEMVKEVCKEIDNIPVEALDCREIKSLNEVEHSTYQEIKEQKGAMNAEDRMICKDYEKPYASLLLKEVSKLHKLDQLVTTNRKLYLACAYGYKLTDLFTRAVVKDPAKCCTIADLVGTGGDVDTTGQEELCQKTHLRIYVKGGHDMGILGEETEEANKINTDGMVRCVVVFTKKDLYKGDKVNLKNARENIRDFMRLVNKDKPLSEMAKAFFVDASSQEAFDNDKEEGGGAQLKQYVGNMVSNGFNELAKTKLFSVIDDFEKLLRSIEAEHKKYANLYIPPEFDLNSLNETVDERQKEKLVEFQRTTKEKLLLQKAHLSLKKLEIQRNLFRLELNSVVDDVVGKFKDSCERLLQEQGDMFEVGSLLNVILSTPGINLFDSSVNAENSYRREKYVLMSSILRDSTILLADVIYRTSIRDKFESLITEGLSTTKEKFDNLFLTSEIGETSFRASLITLVMLRAKLLLEYFVMHSRRMADNALPIYNCKQLLINLGINMEQYAHPNDMPVNEQLLRNDNYGSDNQLEKNNLSFDMNNVHEDVNEEKEMNSRQQENYEIQINEANNTTDILDNNTSQSNGTKENKLTQKSNVQIIREKREKKEKQKQSAII
ncbi:hypothetical protein ABK040_014204 [Willaertia magna]